MSVTQQQSCQFIKSWIGQCKKETINGTDYCKKHTGKTCLCGHQSTHNCERTVGAFVCGMNLCGTCEDNHLANHWGFGGL